MLILLAKTYAFQALFACAAGGSGIKTVGVVASRKAKAFAPKTLAEWLSFRRKTQQQLADTLGLSQSVVSRWLNGRTLPSRRNWPLLQRVTGLPLDVILHPASGRRRRKADRSAA